MRNLQWIQAWYYGTKDGKHEIYFGMMREGDTIITDGTLMIDGLLPAGVKQRDIVANRLEFIFDDNGNVINAKWRDHEQQD